MLGLKLGDNDMLGLSEDEIDELMEGEIEGEFRTCCCCIGGVDG